MSDFKNYLKSKFKAFPSPVFRRGGRGEVFKELIPHPLLLKTREGGNNS